MSPARLAVAAAAAAVLMWGIVPVGTRFLVGTSARPVDPVLFTALRFALAALVLLPALLHARPWRWPAGDRRLALISAGLGIVGYNLPVAIGQVETGAGATALIIAADPILIMLMWCLKRRIVPTRTEIAAALSGAAGVAVLAGPLLAASGGAAGGSGLLWVGLGALCWSGYCVVVVPLAQRHGALAVTATVTCLGSLPLIALAVPVLPGAVDVGAPGLAVIAGLALGSTVAATIAWNHAVAVLPGPVSGQFLFAIPLVGMSAGHLLLGEALSVRSGVALGLILFGLWLSQRPRTGRGSD